MSVHAIYYKDGSKMMRPVNTREEYLTLRNGVEQVANVKMARMGDKTRKDKLVQMNYSCLPNPDGSLKGSKTASNTVAMDIDFKAPKGLSAEKEKTWLKEQMDAVPTLILAKKDELGLLMLERSATKGYHLAFKRKPGLSQEENLKWASNLLGVEFDTGAKDITRVFYSTTANEEDLLFLDDEIFKIETTPQSLRDSSPNKSGEQLNNSSSPYKGEVSQSYEQPLNYLGLPYTAIIAKWWELNNEGKEPVQSNRDVLTFELAVNLRHICGFDRDLMDRVIPCYDDFPQIQKLKCIDSALAEKRTQMPKRLKDVLFEVRREILNHTDGTELSESREFDEAVQEDDCFYYNRLPLLPMGVKETVDAVGPGLAMPVIIGVIPAIGALATGVKLDVHGKKNTLNLIAYIAGDYASRKGEIDPLIEAWMSEVKAIDEMYLRQEDEWRAKKRAAKNKKDQPEEPKLPVRFLTLNNTVANLAERLANTDGKHAFSFTPEADTVAQKWKSTMSDFSVMLRQSYDGTRFDREARSVDAVNVHIERLLWNVTMCGTPDALYRVVNNYTDGFQSRIALAKTPDNTYSRLEDSPYNLTETQADRIRQVAHLLSLMQGDIELPKLEAKGREWVEQIRIESIKSDDKVRARQRFRICVTAQRMTCCIMLCRVAGVLISKHGFTGAEKQLKTNPAIWKDLLIKAQTPQLLQVYDVLADYLLDCALYFFKDRIENAFNSRDYAGTTDRQRMGRNDSIFERLDVEFSMEGAIQHSISVKGVNVSRNSVHQMLKNWRKQGLIVKTETGNYRKVQGACH